MALQERGVPTLLIIPLIQLFVLFLLFLALLYGQRELAILTILVLSFVGGVWLWTRAGLTGLTCHSRVDKEKAFPGEKLSYVITAENKKILPIWLQIMVPVSGRLHPVPGEKALYKEGSLLWYQRAHFKWELTAQRRGVHQIGPPHILAGDLFAFFTRRKKSEEFHTVLVYPRLVPIRAFSLPRFDFFGIPGAKSPVQDPIFILGTRDYQQGRPAKFIHWKASARRNSLQEKVLEPTQQEKVLLMVDVNRFAKRNAEDAFEKTLESVASLAALLDQQGHAIGLATNGVAEGKGAASVPISRNNQQLPAIMETLARLQMKAQGDILDVLRGGMTLTWGLSCVCFCYEEERTVGIVAEYFKQIRTPIMFFVCRPSPASEENRPTVQRKVYSLAEMDINGGDLVSRKSG
jgi:uncharacterized protein (DUF58 family)